MASSRMLGAIMAQRSGWWAVLVGGLAGGTLDILFAISFAAYNGMPPLRLRRRGAEPSKRAESLLRRLTSTVRFLGRVIRSYKGYAISPCA